MCPVYVQSVTHLVFTLEESEWPAQCSTEMGDGAATESEWDAFCGTVVGDDAATDNK